MNNIQIFKSNLYTSILKVKDKELLIISPDKSSRFGINKIANNNSIYDLRFIDDNINVKLFIDAGANIGLSTIWAKTKFPKAKIIAFEPSLSLSYFYKKNTKNFKKINFFNKAVFTNEGMIDFYYKNNHSGASTTNSQMLTGDHRPPKKVEAFDFIEFLDNLNFNRDEVMLKMDIEGGEDFLFQNINFLNILKQKVKYLLIELHGDVQKQVSQYKSLISTMGIENVSVNIQGNLENKKSFVKPLWKITDVNLHDW